MKTGSLLEAIYQGELDAEVLEKLKDETEKMGQVKVLQPQEATETHRAKGQLERCSPGSQSPKKLWG